jgi:hypothetical protein
MVETLVALPELQEICLEPLVAREAVDPDIV